MLISAALEHLALRVPNPYNGPTAFTGCACVKAMGALPPANIHFAHPGLPSIFFPLTHCPVTFSSTICESTMSSLTFSFGAFGDILALAQVAYSLIITCYRAFDSADQYRSLKTEVDSLSYIIDCAHTNISSDDDVHMSPATKYAIHVALSRSRESVEEMKRVLKGYEGCLGDGGSRNVWKNIVGRVM